MARSVRAYRIFWFTMLLVMGIIHISVVLAGLGWQVQISLVVPLAVGILFVVIGNYMGKIRSNFMFGIRTPWTLTSDLSWNKTHRVGGRLFMILGVMLVLTGLTSPPGWWIYLLLGSVLLMVVFLFVYSYLVWREDPAANRQVE